MSEIEILIPACLGLFMALYGIGWAAGYLVGLFTTFANVE